MSRRKLLVQFVSYTPGIPALQLYALRTHLPRCIPEHSFGCLAEIVHQVDADSTDAEYSLQFEPLDQPGRVEMLVGDVHAGRKGAL